jgi:hypothetical protein
VMPPFCTMWTWPSILRTLHVPQIPIERPDGITSPAAFAADRCADRFRSR